MSLGFNEINPYSGSVGRTWRAVLLPAGCCGKVENNNIYNKIWFKKVTPVKQRYCIYVAIMLRNGASKKIPVFPSGPDGPKITANRHDYLTAF